MSFIKFLLFSNKRTRVLGARQYGKENKTEPQETSLLASRQYGHLDKVKPNKTDILSNGKYGGEVDISISRQEDYDKITVADYYTISEYVEKMKEIDKWNIEEQLNTSVVWNSGKQRVNKGTYFVFGKNGNLYNILINDEIIKIDERYVVDKNSINNVITFYNNSKLYDYFTCVHDENGSTFDTKYYSAKGFTSIKAFEMSRNEVVDNWILTTHTLKTFKAIDEIVDVSKLDEYIFVKLDDYLFDKKV